MNPQGKIAVVTGGSSGIGRASARLLAARGTHVPVFDVDELGAAETVRLIEANGGAAELRRVDVSSPSELADAFDEVVAARGAVHILHNNAGLVAGAPDFPETSVDRIAAVVGVNVTGTIVGTRLAVEAMRRTGGGVIVNMSSMLALATKHRDPVYAATKAAVKLFTELCAPLAATHGVRVNALLPGGVDTPILGKTGSGNQPADWLENRLGEIELLPVEAIAAAVLELVEDESKAGACVEIRNPLRERAS